MITDNRSDRSWADIRVLGPIAMIVFGLALVFTPLASVSSMGSVGNAGVNGKPTTTLAPDPTTTTLAPDPTTTTLAPDPTTSPTVTATSAPATTVATTVDSGVDAGGASGARPGELPRTGARDRSAVITLFGLAFIVAGSAMLGMSRRRARA